MRAVIAGGGTGGHVIPALAIAQELQSRYGCATTFLGTSRGIETRLVPKAGFELKLIEVGQLNRVSLATRCKTLASLPLSILEARRILRDLRPDVLISVGGYASGPGSLAAISMGLPVMVFEPNVVPGMANRRIARWARAAAVHFEQTGKFFKRYKVTGVPVRRSFFELPAPAPGKLPTLLVFGGSQGAKAINRAVVEAAPELHRRMPNLRIIHQTGEREYPTVADAYAKASVPASVSAFIDDMPSTFAASDLIVCRSGASTVAEIAAAGKAAIFVPLPTAADDHQRHNAETLVKQGAALMLQEKELTPQRLVETVVEVLGDPERLVRIGTAARNLAHPNAAAEIAAMAAELAVGK